MRTKKTQAATAHRLKMIHWIAYDKCDPLLSSGSATLAGRLEVMAGDSSRST